MVSKVITAKLKDEVSVAIRVELEFDNNWLPASTTIERTKKQLLYDLKDKLHTKIAMLEMDDVLFKVIES